jgi:uncharacterized repeat protein (TIGR01451 family)
MSCNPGLRWNVDAVFSALQNSSDVPPPGICGAPPDGEGNYTYGYGYVNVLAAGLANCLDLPELRIAKNIDIPLPLAGDVLTYTLTYTNSGASPAYGAVITDFLPVEVEYLTSYPTGTYDAGAHSVAWLVDVPTDTTEAIALIVHLDEDTPVSTVVTNTVTLAWGGQTITDTAIFTTAGAPAADFSYTVDGLTATFTNTTLAGYPSETNYGWNFGDGVTSTIENPIHLYEMVESYTATLKACNAIGCSIDIERVDTCLLPEAGFITTTLGLTAYFTNTSQSASGYLWDFGDGITGTLTDPQHGYALDGNYQVRLWATNDCGVDEEMRGISVVALADLMISKEASQSVIPPGSPLTYTITVVNLGPDAASGIVVIDVLPAGVVYQAGGPGCSQENGVVSCAVASLASGGQVSFILCVLAPGEAGEMTNLAYASSSVNDPDLTDNQAAVQVLVSDAENTIFLPIMMR